MSVLDQPLVFVDIETNGLDHIRGRVIEVAAIRVEQGVIVREFRSLIDPGAPLPHFITKLTGIHEHDLADAPLFLSVADELEDIMAGAIFVAHNVRFDYAFLKQEFKRIGKRFSPRQLCTMRLSRTLFPEQRGHKLQDLITRHDLVINVRHRAYDDAHALWQFLQKIRIQFDNTIIEQAITKQLKKPSLPKALQTEDITSLPEGTGVYIMYDKTGAPLYVGKSIHIRQRVTEHFMRDHDNVGEFKLAQRVHSITAHETNGELEALLLESQLVKELLPYQNKLLRRTQKILLAIKEYDDAGYIHIRPAMANPSEVITTKDILGVYDTRSKLRASLEVAIRDWELCPKLVGLEKTSRACFWSQLGKCRGACRDAEPAETYNYRVLQAFERQKVQPWPYTGPILVQEKAPAHPTIQTGLIIDRWCVLGKLRQEMDCEPVLERRTIAFDLDTYHILKTYFSTKLQRLSIQHLSTQQIQRLGI